MIDLGFVFSSFVPLVLYWMWVFSILKAVFWLIRIQDLALVIFGLSGGCHLASESFQLWAFSFGV